MSTKTEFEIGDFLKTSILTVCLFAMAAIPAKLGAQAAAPPPSDMTGKTAGQYYKNLKVLKDIPAENLHPAMEYITVALGVGCGNCHDVRKFESDDKANKRTARGMMLMEFALNTNIFDGQTRVTCYTCHRGQPEGAAAQVFPGDQALPGATPVYPPLAVRNPVLDTTMAVVKPTPGVAATTAPAAPAKLPVVLPSVDEVMAKYAQSLGGSDAVKKASTLVESGTVEMELPNPPGTTGPPKVGRVDAEVERKSPDMVLYHVNIASGVNTEGYDGSMAWLRMNAVREVTGGERTVMQERAEFFPVQRFKDTHSELKVGTIESIANRQAYRVSGLRMDGGGYDHFDIDAENGQLLHLSTYMVSVLGSFPFDIDYSDYRDVNGLKLPFTVREVSPESDRTYRWDRIAVNGALENSVFSKPAPPPPAAAAPAPR